MANGLAGRHLIGRRYGICGCRDLPQVGASLRCLVVSGTRAMRDKSKPPDDLRKMAFEKHGREAAATMPP